MEHQWRASISPCVVVAAGAELESGQIDLLQFHVQTLQQRYERLGRDHAQTTQSAEELKRTMLELQRANKKLGRESRRAAKDTESVRLRVAELSKSSGMDQQEMALLRKQLGQGQEAQQRLEEERTALRSTLAELKQGLLETDALRSSLGQSQAEQEMAAKRVEHGSAMLRAAEAEQDRLLAEGVKLQYACARAEEAQADATALARKRKHELDESAIDNREGQEQLHSARRQVEKLQGDKEELGRQAEQLSLRNAAMQQELGHVEATLEQLNQHATQLQQDNSALTVQLKTKLGSDGGAATTGYVATLEHKAASLSGKLSDLTSANASCEEARHAAELRAHKADKALQRERAQAAGWRQQASSAAEALKQTKEDCASAKWGVEESVHELEAVRQQRTRLQQSLDQAELTAAGHGAEIERLKALVTEFELGARRWEEQKRAAHESHARERGRREAAERQGRALAGQRAGQERQVRVLQEQHEEMVYQLAQGAATVLERDGKLAALEAALSAQAASLEAAHMAAQKLEQGVAERTSQAQQLDSRLQLEVAAGARAAQHFKKVLAHVEDDRARAGSQLQQAEAAVQRLQEAQAQLQSDGAGLEFERRKLQTALAETEVGAHTTHTHTHTHARLPLSLERTDE